MTWQIYRTPQNIIKTDHILDYNTSLNKLERIQVILKIFSEHNAIKLEINNKKTEKTLWFRDKKKQTLLNDLWSGTEIAMKITKYLDLQMSRIAVKHLGCSLKQYLEICRHKFILN